MHVIGVVLTCFLKISSNCCRCCQLFYTKEKLHLLFIVLFCIGRVLTGTVITLMGKLTENLVVAQACTVGDGCLILFLIINYLFYVLYYTHSFGIIDFDSALSALSQYFVMERRLSYCWNTASNS